MMAWGQEPRQQPIETFLEWKGFPAGAWKRVRVRRETYDAKGKLVNRSTADTTTTLLAIDGQGFTLRADVNVEVAGRRFTLQPQEIWYGFNGETKGEVVSAKLSGSDSLELNGRKVDTQVCEVVVRSGKVVRTITAHCADIFPDVIRKQSITVDHSGEQPKELERVTSEVVALDLPHWTGTEVKSACLIRTVAIRPDARTVTLELHCEDVPGRVVAHWSSKWNGDGALVERSVLELVDYSNGDATNGVRFTPLRRPLFPRHHPGRPN